MCAWIFQRLKININEENLHVGFFRATLFEKKYLIVFIGSAPSRVALVCGNFVLAFEPNSTVRLPTIAFFVAYRVTVECEKLRNIKIINVW